MNPTHPLRIAAALTLGLMLGACDAPKTDTKAADAKTDTKTADAKKVADQKGGPGGMGGAIDKAKKDAKAGDVKAGDAKAGDVKAVPTGRKYRRGQFAPPGMSVEELKKFAVDTGDPTGGEFTLEQAFTGDPDLADKSKGTLTASFETTMGNFDCELFEDKVPLTVANFVGLARGKRPTYDKKTDSWVETNYYDGVIFHRVIKNFMIQTGDAAGTGRGNPGYVIPDEFDKSLKHGSAGILSMANRSQPNTGSTQFFITARDTKHLDGKHAVFGKCPNAKVPVAISEVKVDHRAGDRPYETVKINKVTISRKK